RAFFDPCVEIGLREGRLISFVVSIAAIAIQVDDHVAPELLTEIECQIADKFHRKRIVAVYMENRGFDDLSDVRSVPGRSRIFGKRSEANLIVHHNVNGAASAVTVYLRQAECLGYDLLR